MKNGKAHILVVDDDERTRRMMESLLIPQGYGILLAKDGKEAIEVARARKPDFIFMDMMMPEMDGLTACSRLKQHALTSRIPLYMLTAVSGGPNRLMAQVAWGADGYLTKPAELEELLTTIRRHVPVN